MSGIDGKSAGKRESKGGITSAAIILLVVSVAVMLPALGFGDILRGQDALIHTRWQAAYAPVFWSGDIFPRWLPDMNKGFGSPVFFIYPPLSQMFAALAYPLAPGTEWTSYRIALSVTVAIFAGAFGTFLWLKNHTASRSAPIWGAIAYTLAPYHLFIDTYFRGAFAEVWSFAPLPFALLTVDHFFRKVHAAFAGLVLSLACAILLHAPSMLITVPVVGLYAALAAWRQRSFAPCLLFLAAAATAMLLCGAYLGTALTQVNMIRSEKLFGGLLVSTKWLLGRNVWPDIPIMVMVIVAAVAQVGVAIDLFRNAVTRERTGLFTSRLTFPLILMIVSVIMTTDISEPLWSLNTPLNRIQFPWRLLSIQALAIAVLCAYAIDKANVPATAVGAVAHRSVFFAIGLMLAINAALYIFCIVYGGDSGRVREALIEDTTDAPEYQLGDIKLLVAHFPGNARTLALSGSGNIDVTQWKPRRIELATSSPEEMRVAIRQFAYTGWQYSQDGGPMQDAGILSDDEPVVVISIPPGAHNTVISMPPTKQETVGWMASLGGLLCLAAGTAALARWRPAHTGDIGFGRATQARQN